MIIVLISTGICISKFNTIHFSWWKKNNRKLNLNWFFGRKCSNSKKAYLQKRNERESSEKSSAVEKSKQIQIEILI